MSPMDRRKFIKLTAITGTSAALASCGHPEHQLIRFIPEEDLVPGVSTWKPSVCPLCQAGCGIVARVVEGEAEVFRKGQPGVIRMGLAKKLEGKADDPISHGKMCARGQAALQVTYHPDRLSAPMKRKGDRGKGEFVEISWDEAEKLLIDQLDTLAAAKDQQSLSYLTRPRASRRMEPIAQFLSRFGAPPAAVFDPLGDGVLKRANELSFGHHQLPTLDLAQSRYVISFGADFLGTWNSPVAQGVAFGAMRGGRPGVRGKFVQAEPRMSTTGASADEWVAVRPGTEGVLALGLAHLIMKAGVKPAAAAARAGGLIDGWSTGLAAYSPDQVEQKTGVRAARIERIARELAANAPAMAVIGGVPLAYTNGLFQALAVNALNALVGSVGQPGGLNFPESAATKVPQRSAKEYFGGPPAKVLMLDEANPVYASPASSQVVEHLAKVPFIVSFGSFVDETSAHADLILPDHSFLEAPTELGEAVMHPLYDTRSTADVIAEVAGKLKQPIAAAPVAAATRPAPAAAAAPKAVTPAASSEASFDGDVAQLPFHFLPYVSQLLLDGSIAHLPWLQETPDPLTSAMWSSWVEINEQTAIRLGIGAGDVVEVASAHGHLRAAAVLSPGVAPDVIAMPFGQGHTHFTRYATGRGANPFTVLGASTEPETGALAWAATRVKVTRVSGPDESLILFAGATRERPEEAVGR